MQDTDLSYRPRVGYTWEREWGHGRWDSQERGQCVDHVVRGCFNNGTCVAPNTCACAPGWEGHDCSVPQCSQTCGHHGNCTLPNTCTCERGWEGHDCSVPQCSQQCLNGGACVAPDTCQCTQWPTEWYDRRKTSRPLFQKPNGDPMLTGFTGFDCSVPICSMHEEFVLNVDRQTVRAPSPGKREVGGGREKTTRGGDCVNAVRTFLQRGGRRETAPRVFFFPLHGGKRPNVPCTPCARVVWPQVNRNAYTWSNVPTSQLFPGYREYGGHGHDGELECDAVRCPRYDEEVRS